MLKKMISNIILWAAGVSVEDTVSRLIEDKLQIQGGVYDFTDKVFKLELNRQLRIETQHLENRIISIESRYVDATREQFIDDIIARIKRKQLS